MTIKQEMKKIDMINMMLDNNYPSAWRCCPSWVRKTKTVEECREWAVHHLQYTTIKEDIYKMFRNYLYWKIEKNVECGECW